MTGVVPLFNAIIILCLQVLDGDRIIEETEVDRKPFYLFGTTQDCDFRPSVADLAAPQHFAALVHHQDSRLFLISLSAVISATKVFKIYVYRL